jgi:hypothetical protein
VDYPPAVFLRARRNQRGGQIRNPIFRAMENAFHYPLTGSTATLRVIDKCRNGRV